MKAQPPRDIMTKKKKPKQSSLHSPCLRSTFEDCLQCGYPLEGIPVPGQCPECGLHFYDGRSTLNISGIAKGSSGPLWRKIIWIIIGVFGFVYSQLWALAMMKGFGWFALLGFVALVASVASMVLTSKQKNRGTEHFVFTYTGLSRWTVGSDPTTRIFIPWPGFKRSTTITRVSSKWAKLKIVAVDEQGKHTCPLEAGFRCPQEDIAMIQNVINALLLNQPMDTIDLLEQSAFYSIEPGAGCPDSPSPAQSGS